MIGKDGKNVHDERSIKMLGVHIRTLQKWDEEGKIHCVRTVGGKRRVPKSEAKRILGLHEKKKVIGYARVSSHTQRDDLERQIEAISQYAKERGFFQLSLILATSA